MLDYRTHTFLEVYRRRSYTEAARALLITQPAVSQHVKQLESHYGCRLFTKTGRGIEPTPSGDMLYQQLLTMKNDELRMRAEAQALARCDSAHDLAPLIFGCTRTIADYVAPSIIAAHLKHHPSSPVTLQAGNTRELIRNLDEGKIDFALVEGSFDRSRFAYEVLSREKYVAIASGHGICPHGIPKRGENPWARPLSIHDLLSERLILREPGSGTREILQKHLAARDLSTGDFAGIVELGSIPTIKKCVQAGEGISFLYRVAVEPELERGDLEDITPLDFEIEHDFCLIWQIGSHYGPRFRALCDAWRQARA